MKCKGYMDEKWIKLVRGFVIASDSFMNPISKIVESHPPHLKGNFFLSIFYLCKSYEEDSFSKVV
jgi:hypothetical protein